MWKIALLVVVVGYLINSVFVGFRLFEIHYNHFPGQCTVFEIKHGAEDMIVLPNGEVIISSGLLLHPVPNESYNGGLYVSKPGSFHTFPKRLTFENDYLSNHPDFNPHGISYWMNEDLEIFLYLICHWKNGTDTIDVFQYFSERNSVKYIRSIFDDSASNLNNLIILDKDEMYVTNYKYFNIKPLRILEQLLGLPLSVLYYVKNGNFKTVASQLRSANGINMSRNRKFIYVLNSLARVILAYKWSPSDGSIQLVDSIYLGHPLDNLYVDNNTGHLWLPMFIKPLDTIIHFENTSLPVPAQVIQITVDETADRPFDDSKIESVYTSDGRNGVGAISSAIYTNGTLMLGSVCANMIVCDVNYLEYS